MMMMMNCFCGMVDQRKAFSLISSRNRCQRSSTSWISSLTMPRTWIQNLFEWSCAIVITTTARRQNPHKRFKMYTKDAWLRVPILWNQYIFIKSVYQITWEIFWLQKQPSRCSHFGMCVLQHICCIFSEHLFIRTSVGACFCNF